MSETITTTVPGTVWKVLVTLGDRVAKDDVLFILEVMKTEVAHLARIAGTVSAVHLLEGDVVDADFVAIEIAP